MRSDITNVWKTAARGARSARAIYRGHWRNTIAWPSRVAGATASRSRHLEKDDEREDADWSVIGLTIGVVSAPTLGILDRSADFTPRGSARGTIELVCPSMALNDPAMSSIIARINECMRGKTDIRAIAYGP